MLKTNKLLFRDLIRNLLDKVGPQIPICKQIKHAPLNTFWKLTNLYPSYFTIPFCIIDEINNIYIAFVLSYPKYYYIIWGRRSHEHVIVGFTTTCTVSAYHH